VIVLGIVLYSSSGLVLEANDKAEAIRQEYITMLRYERSTSLCSVIRGVHHYYNA
jgi:hypothetical protein